MCEIVLRLLERAKGEGKRRGNFEKVGGKRVGMEQGKEEGRKEGRKEGRRQEGSCMMKIGDRLGGIFGYRGVWWGYEVFGCWVTRI